MSTQEPTRRYWWVCANCGSKNVNCSGILRWDFTNQCWVFDGTPLDDDYCEDCDEEVRVVQLFEDEPSLAQDPQNTSS